MAAIATHKIPEYWNLMSDYRTARDFVKQMEATNDCAERGIKLIGDYKDYTQDKKQCQYIRQVVENHRMLHLVLLSQTCVSLI